MKRAPARFFPAFRENFSYFFLTFHNISSKSCDMIMLSKKKPDGATYPRRAFCVYRKAVTIVNARQRQFCEEYLIDLNATQAAIRAGYAERYASTNAHKLLQITAIKEKIDELMAARAKRTEITQDRVLRELAIIAFSNAADYAAVVEEDAYVEIEGERIKLLDDDGNVMKYRTVQPVLTADLTEEQKRALSVIKKGRDGFEVKPYDKVRALELLGKHLGMFQDKVEVSGEINNPMAGLTTEDLKKLIEDG